MFIQWTPSLRAEASNRAADTLQYSHFTRRALVLLLFVFTPASLLAQSFGSVSGNVTDPTGAAVPGAAITATQTQTGTKTAKWHHSPGQSGSHRKCGVESWIDD